MTGIYVGKGMVLEMECGLLSMRALNGLCESIIWVMQTQHLRLLWREALQVCVPIEPNPNFLRS